jgi:cardiolipin synthase C
MQLRSALAALVAAGCAATPLEPHPAPLAPCACTSLRDAFESLPEPLEEAQALLLDDGPGAWAARWAMLASAKSTVDVSYFIMDDGLYGAAFLGHLLVLAERGVRVRVLVDGVGEALSDSRRGRDYVHQLRRHPNAELRVYRTIRRRVLEALVRRTSVAALASEHDKIILVDDRRAIVGGRNIAGEYFDAPEARPDAFHDTDLLLEGDGVGEALGRIFARGYSSPRTERRGSEWLGRRHDRGDELRLVYLATDAWMRRGRIPRPVARALETLGLPHVRELERRTELRGILARPAAPRVRVRARILDSVPRAGDPDDQVTDGIARLVRATRRTVLAQSPYLVLSPRAVAFLEENDRRGVRLDLVTNSPMSTDNPLSQAFFVEQWAEVAARVPGLRLYGRADRHNVHSKTAVLDDTVTLVGTYNLDPLSMAVDGELLVALWSEELAAQMRRSTENISAGAREYRVARGTDGGVLRDADGRVVVAFGPVDHVDADSWRRVAAMRKWVRRAEWLIGFEPFLAP